MIQNIKAAAAVFIILIAGLYALLSGDKAYDAQWAVQSGLEKSETAIAPADGGSGGAQNYDLYSGSSTAPITYQHVRVKSAGAIFVPGAGLAILFRIASLLYHFQPVPFYKARFLCELFALWQKDGKKRAWTAGIMTVQAVFDKKVGTLEADKKARVLKSRSKV